MGGLRGHEPVLPAAGACGRFFPHQAPNPRARDVELQFRDVWFGTGGAPNG